MAKPGTLFSLLSALAIRGGLSPVCRYTVGHSILLPPRVRRAILLRVCLLCAIVTALWGFAALWTNVLARLHLHADLTWYDLGLYGLAPSLRYRTLEGLAPSIEFLRADSRCSQDPIFLGWRGPNVPKPAGVILDADGELVWLHEGFHDIQQNLMVQTYRGERFLTFWTGASPESLTTGRYHMVDESYTERFQIKPSGFPGADMHELFITRDDTAIVTIYSTIPIDLTPIGGPADGWLLDSFFQELDIETGEVLFQWQASAHIPLNATFQEQNHCETAPHASFAGCGYEESSPFDFYHLNSVQKDSQGNYLVSGRHVFAVSYVEGRTGDILWHLGAGHLNNFKDLSDGAATDFKWQHHTRWIEEGRRLSLFNNDNHGYRDPAGESRGMVIDLDIAHRTASLRATYAHPRHLLSESQGNMQTLPNGNQLIGWGSGAAFTEFSPQGEVLCDARFGAESLFSFVPVMSYRVVRHAWVGRPINPPVAKYGGGRIFVSWNGATEVDRWQVEAAEEQYSKYLVSEAQNEEANSPSVKSMGRTIITQQRKEGFETQIQLPAGSDCTLVRVVALGKLGERLGKTELLEVVDELVLLSPLNVLIILTAMLVSFLLTVGLVIARHQRLCHSCKDRGGYKLVAD